MICEGIIRCAITLSDNKSLSPKFGLMILATKTLEMFQGKKLLKQFAIHHGDHSLLLINAIIYKYLKIRLYHESKLFTQTHKKESKQN